MCLEWTVSTELDDKLHACLRVGMKCLFLMNRRQAEYTTNIQTQTYTTTDIITIIIITLGSPFAFSAVTRASGRASSL